MEHTSHNYRLDVAYELPAQELCIDLVFAGNHPPLTTTTKKKTPPKTVTTTTTKDSLCKEFQK